MTTRSMMTTAAATITTTAAATNSFSSRETGEANSKTGSPVTRAQDIEGSG